MTFERKYLALNGKYLLETAECPRAIGSVNIHGDTVEHVLICHPTDYDKDLFVLVMKKGDSKDDGAMG